MQPTSKFGEVFQYNNLMATAAGYIGGHAAYPNLDLGTAYDRAMQTMVFDPENQRLYLTFGKIPSSTGELHELDLGPLFKGEAKKSD